MSAQVIPDRQLSIEEGARSLRDSDVEVLLAPLAQVVPPGNEHFSEVSADSAGALRARAKCIDRGLLFERFQAQQEITDDVIRSAFEALAGGAES